MKKSTWSIVISSALLLGIPTSSLALVTANSPSTTPAIMVNSSARPSLTAILQSLNASGYPIIKSVEIDDGMYEIEAINYLGKNIKFKSDLNGNLVSKSKTIKPISLISAVQTLEAKGYQVQEIDISGKLYKAKVLNATGEASTVKVNAENAMVSS